MRPEKHMNDIAIRPTTMNVMPRPRSGAGTFEYAIFSRTAANATIASNQPMPEPNAYTTALPRSVMALERLTKLCYIIKRKFS